MLASVSIGILSLLLTGFAPPPDAVANEPAQEPVEAIADDIMWVIDIVLAEHFAPPTKQEMIAAAIRAMAIRAINHTERQYIAEQIAEDSRIANAVSKATHDELRSLLLEAVRKSNLGGTASEMTTAGAHAIFAVIPGGGSILAQKDHLIEESLAANRYVGIGIALKSEEGKAIIGNVVPGGPCHVAGIPEGARILEIDGREVGDQHLTDLIPSLRGPEGSEVTLVLQFPSGDGPVEYRLTRGVVPFKHVHIFESGPPDQKIAVLRIGRLTPSVPHELRAYAARATGLAGVIIDLSQTQSGSMHDAILVADVLLDSGNVGLAVSIKGAKTVRLQADALFIDLPMQVVIGPNTVGTVEWLAASLVENRRAMPFGEPSGGAAVGRESFTLPSGRYVVDLATTVLLSKSGQRLTASIDRHSAQLPHVVREQHEARGWRRGGVRHGRLHPAVDAVDKLEPALEPFGNERSDVPPPEYIQKAVEYFQKNQLKRTPPTDTDERQ
jgi:hypothetical protein